MNMKKFLFIITLLLVSSIPYSCNEDLLEIEQKGVRSTSVYETADDNDAKSLIAAVYADWNGAGGFNVAVRGFASWFVQLEIILNTLSDDGFSGGTFSDNASTYQSFNRYDYDSEQPLIQHYWTHFYMVIYKCNMIIEKLADDTDYKRRVIAEAKAIRAISMMYLVTLWGNPPLVDHVLLASELQMSNTPAGTSWEWIEGQLSEAASGLPSKSGPNGQAAIGGRLTKEAAYAYLGKAQLLQGKWSAAATTLKDKVIDTELYGLIDNFNDLNFSKNDFSKENIWEHNIANDPNTNNQQGDMRGAWYGYRTEYVVQPDEMMPLMGWGYGQVSGDFGRFFEEHELRSDGTLSERWYGTLMTYEELLDETRWTYNTYGRKGVYNPPLQNNAGYFRLKKAPYEVDRIAGSTQPSNFRFHNNNVHMRYAEVLLMYAEATIQQNSQAGLGALNEVRTRAGLEPLASYTLDDLKAEKRAECFFEGCRFIDLVRWGDAATVLKDKGKLLYSFYGYEDGTVNIQSKDQWKITTIETGSSGFVAGKHELWPYPLVELQSNPNLEQNPGW